MYIIRWHERHHGPSPPRCRHQLVYRCVHESLTVTETSTRFMSPVPAPGVWQLPWMEPRLRCARARMQYYIARSDRCETTVGEISRVKYANCSRATVSRCRCAKKRWRFGPLTVHVYTGRNGDEWKSGGRGTTPPSSPPERSKIQLFLREKTYPGGGDEGGRRGAEETREGFPENVCRRRKFFKLRF